MVVSAQAGCREDFRVQPGGSGECQELMHADAPLRESEPDWFIRRSYSDGSEEKGQEEEREEEEVILVARCVRTTKY